MSLASVLLIEDDSFTRSTLAALISQRGFNLVGAVDNAEEALLLQKLHKPEVVISDVDLGPGPTGIDIVTALREIDPRIGVILLTSFSDPRFIKDSSLELPKGTLYFTKSKLSDVTKLMTAILQVKNRPLFHFNNQTKNEINLTENQIDILRRVSEGQTTSVIAKEKEVSEKSIEAALSKIHSNLGLKREKTLNPRVQLTRAYLSLIGKKLPGE